MFAELAQSQVDGAATAAQQPLRQAVQRLFPRGDLIRIEPEFPDGPLSAQNVRMGQWLIEALPPTGAAHVEPELHFHGPVAHQEGKRRRQQDGILLFRFPIAEILRCQHALLHQFDIFLRGRFFCGQRAGNPPEFLHRFDEVGSHPRAVIILVEVEARLREQLAEEPAQEMIEFFHRRGAVLLQPQAQRLVTPAQQIGDSLLHLSLQAREGFQVRSAPFGTVKDFGEQLRAHQIQCLDSVNQRRGYIVARWAEAPGGMSQSGEGEQRPRRRFLAQCPRGPV